MSTTALNATDVKPEHIDAVGSLLPQIPESPLRDFIANLMQNVSAGENVTLLPTDMEMTPNEAAKLLKVSRSFLIKLMDAGELPYHRVGRDRRLHLKDVLEFREKRDEDSRRFAEERARHTAMRNAAIDEMTDLI